MHGLLGAQCLDRIQTRRMPGRGYACRNAYGYGNSLSQQDVKPGRVNGQGGDGGSQQPGTASSQQEARHAA